MDIPVSASLRNVPDPMSSSRDLPSPRRRMAGEDLLTEGTQVPEPRTVTLIPIALLYITDLQAGHTFMGPRGEKFV